MCRYWVSQLQIALIPPWMLATCEDLVENRAGVAGRLTSTIRSIEEPARSTLTAVS